VFFLLGAEVGGEQVAGGAGAGVLGEVDEINGRAALVVEIGDFFLELGGGVFEFERDRALVGLDVFWVSVSVQVSPFNIPGISRCAGLHFLADGLAFFAVGAHEFVVELEVHPHAGGDAKQGAETQVVFRGAAAFALFHLGEVGGGNAAAAGDLRLGQAGFLKRVAEGLGEEVEQRDELRFLFHGGGSMIVGDLDVGGGAVFPAEDDAPLLVDADAPESLEIARE
jgi:hypothetical protein